MPKKKHVSYIEIDVKCQAEIINFENKIKIVIKYLFHERKFLLF